MARLRATALAARSVLDGREHGGTLDRVGGPHAAHTRPGVKSAPTCSSKSALMLTASVVLASDLGQPNNPLHTDGLLAFYKGLMALGISEADIVQMSQTNPAKLLGLKP